MYEWIGTAGAIMIIIAFANKDEISIRILDGIGAVLFIIYGVLIHAWATVFLNSILICIHMRRLYQIKKQRNIE